MAIYHVNEKGEAGICRAFVGNCPLGGPEDHFLTKADAARSYELRQAGSFGHAERRELVIIDKNELRIIDARLLDKARELADAHGAEAVEIQAKTEPLAIIRAARVERIMELGSNPGPSLPTQLSNGVPSESPG